MCGPIKIRSVVERLLASRTALIITLRDKPNFNFVAPLDTDSCADVCTSYVYSFWMKSSGELGCKSNGRHTLYRHTRQPRILFRIFSQFHCYRHIFALLDHRHNACRCHLARVYYCEQNCDTSQDVTQLVQEPETFRSP